MALFYHVSEFVDSLRMVSYGNVTSKKDNNEQTKGPSLVIGKGLSQLH